MLGVASARRRSSTGAALIGSPLPPFPFLLSFGRESQPGFRNRLGIRFPFDFDFDGVGVAVPTGWCGVLQVPAASPSPSPLSFDAIRSVSERTEIFVLCFDLVSHFAWLRILVPKFFAVQRSMVVLVL